jgi:hypothetical protein
MPGKTKQTEGQVPTFANEAEAAAFWDSHSPLDYPDEFEEVEAFLVAPIRKRGLTVKLDEDTIQRLTRVARRQGIGPSTLARMWLIERLRALPPEPIPGNSR